MEAIQPGFPPAPGPQPDPDLPGSPEPDQVPGPIDDPPHLPDYEDLPPVRPIDIKHHPWKALPRRWMSIAV